MTRTDGRPVNRPCEHPTAVRTADSLRSLAVAPYAVNPFSLS